MKSVALVFISVLLFTGCGLAGQIALLAGEPTRQFEETISSNFDGSPGSSLRQFAFIGPASLEIEQQADRSISYCLEVFDLTACGQIDRRFDQTTLVYFAPHCQSDIYALEFVLVGEGSSDQSIYYVNGHVTLDLSEAESWVAPDSACIITWSDNSR